MNIETRTFVSTNQQVAGKLVTIVGTTGHGRIMEFQKGYLYVYDTVYVSGILRYVKDSIPSAGYFDYPPNKNRYGVIVQKFAITRGELRNLICELTEDYLGYSLPKTKEFNRVLTSHLVTDDYRQSYDADAVGGKTLYHQSFDAIKESDGSESFGYRVYGKTIATGSVNRNQQLGNSVISVYESNVQQLEALGYGKRNGYAHAVDYTLETMKSMNAGVMQDSANGITSITTGIARGQLFMKLLHGYAFHDLRRNEIVYDAKGEYVIERHVVEHD